jgi:ABC-type amino acid transport substrate-binding protein
MNKKIVLLSVIAVAVFAGYVFVNKKGSVKDSDSFVVGMTAGYAPFVSVNERGEYEGFDIDVANAVAQKMGKKLVLKDLGSMTSLFMALNQGEIDAIIWAISITQDRLNNFAMVHYQGELTNSYPLIFWKQIPAGIRSIDDMKGMTICVEPTSAQDRVLNDYPFITRIPVERVDDALLNIQYGKADAALVEGAIAKKFQQKYPEIKIMDISLNAANRVQGMGIVLKKNNEVGIRAVEKAVAVLKAEGVVEQFEKKWSIS